MTTATLKENAKQILAKTYWMSLVAYIIQSTIVGAVTGTISSLTTGFTIFAEIGTIFSFSEGNPGLSPLYFGGYTLGSILGTVLNIAITIFGANVLSVGLNLFLINSRNTLKPELMDLFKPFNKKTYMNTVVVMLMQQLYIFLWSLLFIVPGIIKALEYFMVPFIAAENPSISYQRALEISSNTMNGEKGFLFELYLSFIGWVLLAVFCTCGFGAIFLIPYMQATFTEYYMYLKVKALTTGLATSEDFGGMVSSEASAPAAATV